MVYFEEWSMCKDEKEIRMDPIEDDLNFPGKYINIFFNFLYSLYLFFIYGVSTVSYWWNSKDLMLYKQIVHRVLIVCWRPWNKSIIEDFLSWLGKEGKRLSLQKLWDRSNHLLFLWLAIWSCFSSMFGIGSVVVVVF